MAPMIPTAPMPLLMSIPMAVPALEVTSGSYGSYTSYGYPYGYPYGYTYGGSYGYSRP